MSRQHRASGQAPVCFLGGKGQSLESHKRGLCKVKMAEIPHASNLLCNTFFLLFINNADTMIKDDPDKPFSTK